MAFEYMIHYLKKDFKGTRVLNIIVTSLLGGRFMLGD